MYINIYVVGGFMRKIEVTKRVFKFEDEIETIIEKRVTKFGTGAKLDCPKEYLGRRAYILISKD
jgi:putative transposon-encoded protein